MCVIVRGLDLTFGGGVFARLFDLRIERAQKQRWQSVLLVGIPIANLRREAWKSEFAQPITDNRGVCPVRRVMA